MTAARELLACVWPAHFDQRRFDASPSFGLLLIALRWGGTCYQLSPMCENRSARKLAKLSPSAYLSDLPKAELSPAHDDFPWLA
jgi:hypothetical protein